MTRIICVGVLYFVLFTYSFFFLKCITTSPSKHVSPPWLIHEDSLSYYLMDYVTNVDIYWLLIYLAYFIWIWFFFSLFFFSLSLSLILHVVGWVVTYCNVFLLRFLTCVCSVCVSFRKVWLLDGGALGQEGGWARRGSRTVTITAAAVVAAATYQFRTASISPSILHQAIQLALPAILKKLPFSEISTAFIQGNKYLWSLFLCRQHRSPIPLLSSGEKICFSWLNANCQVLSVISTDGVL